MSININSNQLGNVVNTFNNGQVNNEQVNNGKKIDLSEWESDFGAQPQIEGREALGGAEVRPLEEEIRRRVPARHSFFKSLAGLGKLLGRAFMRACHVVNNALSRAIPKKSRRDFKDDMQVRFAGLQSVSVAPHETGDESKLPNGTNVPESTVVSYTKEEVGAALGLGKPVTIKKFSSDDIDQIKKGDFNLDDIEQDPNLQNCWFLSSLTSVLAFKGASAIQKLITIQKSEGSNTEDYALVKLGVGTYKVPLGDVMGKGNEIGTSSSKPWVRLLETAMQMHMVNLFQKYQADSYGIKIDMNGGSPARALGALLGLESEMDAMGRNLICENITVLKGDNADCDSIANALKNNIPVVLCSGEDWGPSLKYGFSPGHAVSVQAVETTGKGRNFLHILDPYGRSVVLDAGILKNGATVFIGGVLKDGGIIG